MDRLLGTLLAFFLAVGVASHSLDELHDRPLGTEMRLLRRPSGPTADLDDDLSLAAQVGQGKIVSEGRGDDD